MELLATVFGCIGFAGAMLSALSSSTNKLLFREGVAGAAWGTFYLIGGYVPAAGTNYVASLLNILGVQKPSFRLYAMLGLVALSLWVGFERLTEDHTSLNDTIILILPAFIGLANAGRFYLPITWTRFITFGANAMWFVHNLYFDLYIAAACSIAVMLILAVKSFTARKTEH